MEDLRRELRAGRLVIVAGAGVSAAAAELPGWLGALESAIAYLGDVRTADQAEIDAVEQELQQAVTPDDLVACAASTRKLLVGSSQGSGEFAAWLKQTFDVPASALRGALILRAIHGLGAPLLTTTNYDKVLSSSALGLEAVTWREAHLLLGALRDGGRVVHLHGVWDQPETVVFGAHDYSILVSDGAYRTFLHTLWVDRTLLFVGCSFDGMRDPDFAALLDWAAETFPHATMRHYALVRDRDYTPEQVDTFLNRWRIQLVPYGSQHEDLAPFLEALAPPRPIAAPRPPRTFVGRQALVTKVLSAVESKQSVLVHGMGGIGKSSLVAEAVSEMQAQGMSDRVIWLDGEGRTLPDLYRELGHIADVPDIEAIPEVDLPARVSLALAQFPSVTIVIDGAADSIVTRDLTQQLARDNVTLIVTARTRPNGFDRYVEVVPLAEAEAKELFCAVAGVSPDESLVAPICTLLAGHPLAIVLAAGRHATEDLPLARLLSRLTSEIDRLNTLVDPLQPPSPMTSVRASLNVSLENLPAALAWTLTALALFAADASFGLLAPALELAESDCEDQLGQLIRRSLVQRTTRNLFHLHPLTRSTVKARVTDDATTQLMVERAFASRFVQLGGTLADAQRALLDDLDSLFAFIRSTTVTDRESRRLMVVGFVILLCEPFGLLERYELTTRFLATAEALLTVGWTLAASLDHAGLMRQLLPCQVNILKYNQRYRDAIETLRTALETVNASSIEDRWFSGAMKCEIGNCFLALNQYPEAAAAMRDALEEATAVGNALGIAQATGQLGLVLLRSGDLDGAEAQYTAAKRIYEDLDDHIGIAACAYHLSEIAARRGEPDTAWSLQVESLDEDFAGDNLRGALDSLERLASTVNSDDQLAIVLARIDALMEVLPYATTVARPGIAASLRSAAYFGARHYERARDMLLAVLAERERTDDVAGQAVCLGRLSIIAMEMGDATTAHAYNERSRAAYEAVGHMVGVITCCLNEIPIALARDEPESAIDYACDAIKFAALRGELETIGRAGHLLATLVVPRLDEAPQIFFPTGDFSFAQYMGVIAGAADGRDLGRIFGSIQRLLQHYGPGGTPPMHGAST